jgi:transposase-like protein
MAGRRRLIRMARRGTPEQIIRKLREADRLLGDGADDAEVARRLEVSEQTYHRWRNQFGGMKADGTKRLNELGREALCSPAWQVRPWGTVASRWWRN